MVERGSVQGQGTILLAEDKTDDVMLLQLVFKRLGVSNSFRVVPDGTSAIQYLKGEGPYEDRQEYPIPRLMLLDLEMPRMNGFEVLSWIRKQPEFKQLPVVVLTCSVFSPDITRAYQLGANSFITKPQNLDEYAATMQQVLGFWLGGWESLPRPSQER